MVASNRKSEANAALQHLDQILSSEPVAGTTSDRRSIAEKLEQALPQFIGTFSYTKYYTFVITDGVKYLAETAGCYWLLDIVFSVWAKIRNEAHVTITLSVDLEKRRATVTMKGDPDEHGDDRVVYEQEIPYTDFPLESITLYLVDGVLLLTSEY
jgi:hypothetical protein